MRPTRDALFRARLVAMNTRAIILAAGRGSRMDTLTRDRPKCLVEVRGKPLLQWQLDALRVSGIDEIAIVTGYYREQVALPGLVEFHNPRWMETNMVASLACAQEWLEQGPCLVTYSDIFYEGAAIRSLLDCAAPLAITYDPHWRALWERRFADPLTDAETLRLRPDGTLAEIGSRPATLDAIEGQYMGVLRFEPAGWAELARIREMLPPVERDRIDMTNALQRVLAAGRVAVTTLRYEGEWGEVDSPRDLTLYDGRS